MRTRVDDRLLEEVERWGFRFACDDCVHFAVEEQRCSLGFHAAPRRAELERTGATEGGAIRLVELCKTYELA